MADIQFEPKRSPAEIAAHIIVPLLIVGIIAGAVAFYFTGGGSGTVTATPEQLQEIADRYRDRRKTVLLQDISELRKQLEAMRKLRAEQVAKADLQNVDLDRALDDKELKFRRIAQQADAEGKAFHEIFDLAKAIEQDMVTVYREFLAAKLAAVRDDLSYEETYLASTVQRPTRQDLDTEALYGTITSAEPGGGLEEMLSEVKTATVEMRAIKEYCKRLLDFTRKDADAPAAGFGVDLEDDQYADIAYRGEELMPDEIDPTYRHDPGSFDSIPARRLITGATPTTWMFVDTWWIIGPFPGDRRRQNLDVRFGPEANVNLDDIFDGKGGTKIGWRFKKWNHHKIEPRNVISYGIWYAWTEIYSDVDREIWIAVGTDDYGKLWVNDELVWVSPKERKPYNATENVQTVKLKQGHNKILYRIENAGGTMGFSLLVRVDE